MKKTWLLFMLLTCGVIFSPLRARSQSIADCIEQLVLDYQKLSSLKSILSQMYKGYVLLDKGYSSVRDVSQGNFSLHKAFLDGLLVVSPAVRKYPRIKAIINDQASIISEYKFAYSGFSRNGRFSPDELRFMMDVYNHLVSASLRNLDDLSMIMTDSKLRMSDSERLTAIDRIYVSSHNQLSFLRRFDDQASKAAAQRLNDRYDHETMQKFYGLK